MGIGIGSDRERRVPHHALDFEQDFLLAASMLTVLFADFRSSEQVDDVLHPDDALQVPILVHDRDGTFPEGPHDLDGLFNRVVLRDGLRIRRHEVADADAFEGFRLDEGPHEVGAGDDSDERLSLRHGNRAESRADHLLGRLGQSRFRRDLRRNLEDRRDLRRRRQVPAPHQLAESHDSDELLPFEDGELVDITGLHLPEGVPDGLVGPDRQEVGRHEVGNPEVLDLVPLHGGPAAGKASIAAERIRKFFRSPRPDKDDEVDSARSEARRDSADPPEPFLDPRHFERRWPFGSRPTLPNRYALGSERQDSASAWRYRSSAGAPTYSLGGGRT